LFCTESLVDKGTELGYRVPRDSSAAKREKSGGDTANYVPRLKKWGDTSPVSPTKLRPWSRG